MNSLYRKMACLLPVLLVLLFSGCGYQQFKTDLFASFEHDSQVGPTGLAWDGKNLVMANGNQILFARNITTDPYYSFSKDTLLNGGAYTSGRFPGPQRRQMSICGMAWEGECCGDGHLWLVDGKKDVIMKIKPNRELLSEFDSPVKSPNGIAFDGHSLWLVSKLHQKIVKFNPDLMAIEKVYYSPIERPTGITWDCNGFIWVVGMDDCRNTGESCVASRLVKLDVESGRFTHEVPLPPMLLRPSSVALGDGCFWVGDYDLNRIFKIDYKKRNIKPLTLKPNDFE